MEAQEQSQRRNSCRQVVQKRPRLRAGCSIFSAASQAMGLYGWNIAKILQERENRYEKDRLKVVTVGVGQSQASPRAGKK
jgi:hypothetical protein